MAHAAERLLGTPFLLHGRDPETGLDCVGLVAACFIEAGHHVIAPQGYGLRNRTIEGFLACVERSGLRRVSDAILIGDIILAVPGPGQHHLLIATGANHFIHAHAGLRRIVRLPGPLTYPVVARWRLDLAD